MNGNSFVGGGLEGKGRGGGSQWALEKRYLCMDTLLIKTKIVGTNIIFKLQYGKGDVVFRHPHHHLTEAD